jgi:hypothetical protein
MRFLLLFFALTLSLRPAILGDQPARPPLAAAGDWPARQLAIGSALGWLQVQQQAEGGIGGLGTSCDVAWVAALAEQNPDGPAWTRGGRSLLAVCEAEAPLYLARRDAGRMGKVARAVVAAGADPRQFAGLDLIAELEARYLPDLGLYDADFFFRQNLAILALLEAGRPIPAGVLPAVLAQQRPNGGWGWAVEPDPEGGFITASDLDTTVRTLQVLRGLGLPLYHPAYIAGLDYLAQRQHGDGGWGLGDGPTNSNSTALAIEGILAAGWNPEGPRFQRQGQSPAQVLLGLQEAGGAFVYRPGAEESRLLATLDAIPALLHPYPEDFSAQFGLFLPLVARVSSRS